MLFVFGSNLSGIHGAGAAAFAVRFKGALYGQAVGRQGDSYAIPTKDAEIRHTLPLSQIGTYVDAFKGYAGANPTFKFQVTRIGCGLAGLEDREVAPLFLGSPRNCYFDSAWAPYMSLDTNIWGTL